MRYAGIIKNDFSAAPGTSVTFFTQGCPHRCEGCHNPETWDFEGGEEVTHDTILEVIEAITANGLHRNLCIMGGEPLCPENQFLTNLIINSVKEKLPDTKIYLWTGYCLEDLDMNNNRIKSILEQVDCLIDGPYDKTKRDVSLFMRGSSNQRILYKGTDY
jgi:anaerobic ribonucleoside-triphosphate reductase activating protein